MTRNEAVLVIGGMIAVVIALAAFDWRLGLFAFGVALIAVTIDYRRPA